ncbi:MAG TPA: DUF3142 domain-containing protein [Candidatus Acidoferrum sp.]|jgi:hypothetical protein
MRQPTKPAAIVLLSILAAAAAFAFVHPAPSRASRFDTIPSVVLWAWERPEDLRFLDSKRTAVAFLAETITLPSSTKLPVVHARLQPLRVSPETPLIAVVRIENPTSRTSQAVASVTPEFRSRLATEIIRVQSMPAVRAIQIDFDATASQRDFYSALLRDVRRQIRPNVQLSITALASWCIGDSWLDALPAGTIDEAVPMLFRMGVDSANVANFLHTHHAFPVAACNTSLGLSTDETFSRSILTSRSSNAFPSRSDKRIYIFAPHPWTEREANSILQELHP